MMKEKEISDAAFADYICAARAADTDLADALIRARRKHSAAMHTAGAAYDKAMRAIPNAEPWA